MKHVIHILLLFIYSGISSQNCLHLKSIGDMAQYEACKIGEGAQFYYQFSKEYQQIYDSAIEACPNFATAYHAKSVAFLKSGNFIEWKKLIDKAVQLNPAEYLGTRASCRFQFIHDYKGAIADIDKLRNTINYDLGYTSNGDYHLDIVKALCYKQLGENQKAIQLIESKLQEEKYSPGLYDYYHLGILLNQESKYLKAINAFKMQISINESAEVYFHLAQAHENLGESAKYKQNLLYSEEMYLQGRIMTSDYTINLDKIYLQDIKEEIKNGL